MSKTFYKELRDGKYIFVVLLLLIVNGCGINKNDTTAPDYVLEMEHVTIFSEDDIANADSLRLIPEQIFKDTDEHPIATYGSVVVDGFGRVFIGDRTQYSIHVFDHDGGYLGRFGGEGSGPGEFQWLGRMNIQNNRLYVYDPNGRKINIFNLGTDSRNLPEYESAIVIGSDSWDDFPEPGFVNPGFHSVGKDNSILLFSGTSPFVYRDHPDSIGVKRYYRWNGDHDEQPEVVFEIDEPRHIVTEWFLIPPPFATSGIMATSEDDLIYSAYTDDFLIQKHNALGEYQSAFYYPFEKRALSREEAVKSVDDHEQLQDAVQSMPIPDTWPAVREMFVDNAERLWILVYAKNDEINKWYVLEESGGLLARFELPGGTSIAKVNDMSLYTRETDEETGLQQVVRYSIEMD
ncbi:MAG: 6-bladed beta-propeller [Balneolaceae bacterium]